MYNIYKIVH